MVRPSREQKLHLMLSSTQEKASRANLEGVIPGRFRSAQPRGTQRESRLRAAREPQGRKGAMGSPSAYMDETAMKFTRWITVAGMVVATLLLTKPPPASIS